MSVIVIDPRTQKKVLYTKGADSAILPLLRDVQEGEEEGDEEWKLSNKHSVVESTQRALDQYARAGLRTLCMSKRVSINKYEFIVLLSPRSIDVDLFIPLR